LARILLATFGSLGDLFPYLAIGIELKTRGHEVTIATQALYAERVAAEGLRFHAVGPEVDPTDREFMERAMEARRGTERVLRFMSTHVRASYDQALPAVRDADIVVTHPLTFGALLATEKLQRPWISSALAPISYLSAHDPPVPARGGWTLKARLFGPGAMRAMWNLGERVTRGWMPEVFALRKELGLPGEANPLFAHSPQLSLGLFSKWIAERPPDWPAQTVVTGFPFYDRGDAAPPELEQFLAAAPAPVVFTLGSSAVAVAGNFFHESLGAVARLGVRAVLLVGRDPQGLPARLPENVLAIPYAPHAEIMSRGAATVHQGGVGTTAQALRAGKPELIVPFGHDQFDNANRVKRLGAGESITRRRYTAANVKPVLERLLTERRYAEAAARSGDWVRAERGSEAAADAIERHWGSFQQSAFSGQL
jgi:MGT family glycosyltransferase